MITYGDQTRRDVTAPVGAQRRRAVYLGGEVGGFLGRVVLAVTGHVAATDVLHRHVLDIKAHVVAWKRLGQRLVMHLHRLDLGGDVDGGEGHHHARLQHARFHAAHGHSSDA